MRLCHSSGLDSRRLGFFDIKTSPIQFYVQPTSSFSTRFTTIPWQLTRLNVGDAMNVTTGVFSAPKDGVYHFHFSGITFRNNFFVVNLRLNDNVVGSSNADARGQSEAHDAGSLDSTLQLKKGDRIDLWLWGGLLYDDGNQSTHFTGWLDDEELKL